MTSLSSRCQPLPVRSGPAFRKPKRITITVPDAAYQRLLERSDREGRSLSNLAAFLLESATAARESDGIRLI